jgi:hypothetical protein
MSYSTRATVRHPLSGLMGLGAIDREATDAERAWTDPRGRTWVFSISSVTGLAGPDAAREVPAAIRRRLVQRGAAHATSGWADGGRVWAKYYVSPRPGEAQHPWQDDAVRRAAVLLSLRDAAADVSRVDAPVTFNVAGHGAVTGRGDPADPVSAPPAPPRDVAAPPREPAEANPDSDFDRVETKVQSEEGWIPWAIGGGGALLLVVGGVLIWAGTRKVKPNRRRRQRR